MPTNKILQDKQQFITDILSSDESLQHFIDFWSKQYKYAFYSVLELYANNPQGTFFAETKQWNKADRYIKPGSVSISLHFPDGNHKTVFDISQTQGKEISVWRLPTEFRNQFFFLSENDGIPADTERLMKQILLAAEKEIPRDRLKLEPDISLAAELASHVTAARFDIQTLGLRTDKFEIQDSYNVFVSSHLAARNLIRRAEIFSKGIETNKVLSVIKVEPEKASDTQSEQIQKEPNKSTGKENKSKGGSEKGTPVFHAPKQENTDSTPEQLSFGMVQNDTNSTGELTDSNAENRKPMLVKMRETIIDLTPVDVPTTEEKPEKAAAQAESVNYHIPDDYEPAAGQKGKFKDNIAAISLLKQLETEERSALPDEQTVLARYNGWGGLPQAFDPRNSEWSDDYTQLKGLLTPDEYAAARASTLNAHYTSTEIIDAIYAGLDRMGFSGGNILEPAMGVGNFFGRTPEYENTTMCYGVELDNITGRITNQLYPKAFITIDGFENMKYNADSFDLAVGNVPFGSYSISDRALGNKAYKIHDYFFLKSLELVRPGGIVTLITSTGTLDKEYVHRGCSGHVSPDFIRVFG